MEGVVSALTCGKEGGKKLEVIRESSTDIFLGKSSESSIQNYYIWLELTRIQPRNALGGTGDEVNM
jgi:hypothetical protein